MTQQAETLPTFELPFVPVAYDLLVRFVYLPGGGERRMRAAAVDSLALRSGERVLELGCGTGSFTRRLLASGAEVTAVDGSAPMLERARARASKATFVHQDLRDLEVGERAGYDMVFCGFVLHELAEEERAILLAKVRWLLAPEGRLVIVDHAVPSSGVIAPLWRRFLHVLEPPSVRAIIQRGYHAELTAASFEVGEHVVVGVGLAALWVGRLGDAG